MNLILSFIATGISLAFAGVVLGQYRRRRRPYQLVWGVALLLFAVGALGQMLAELGGWSPLLYRAWYLTGALLAAAYLGQGTVYLLAPRPLADATMVLLATLSLQGAALVSTLPVDLSRAIVGGFATGDGLPKTLLWLVVPLNVYGTVALVGGALWSIARTAARRKLDRRAEGTMLIAVGGLVVALGGTASRLGSPGFLYLAEAVGVALIFLGYLQTVAPAS